MIYLKYILILPVYLLMKIVGKVVAPIVALTVSPQGNLPRWLKWFQTPDSTMFGEGGDHGFFADNIDKTDTYFGRWWVATKWQWRNTCHGFNTWAIGVDDRGLIEHLEWVKDVRDLQKYKKTVQEDGKIVAFEFKGAFQWFNLAKRFRWRIGWKIRWDIRFPAQYVFSVSPFMSMEK